MLTFQGQEMKIFVPGYGDMTNDVAVELAKMRIEENEQDVAWANQRQAYIAKKCGTEAPLLEHGQLVAQIDAAAFADWERREGKGFFADKSSRNDFLKRHPECKVRGIPRRPSIIVPDKSGITRSSRGGRWAR